MKEMFYLSKNILIKKKNKNYKYFEKLIKNKKNKKMSTDYYEMNYNATMDDFEEEIVNSSIIYYIQNTYRELKTIIWKKGCEEIEQDYIYLK